MIETDLSIVELEDQIVNDDRMNRRQVAGRLLALGAMTVPMYANAQVAKGSPPFRIVMFPDLAPPIRNWFTDAMQERGHVEGRDFEVIPSGFDHGGRDIDAAAQRVVLGKPDLFVSLATSAAGALHRATTETPIVMINSGYPIEAGLANSLARPGKNVTGNTSYAGTEIWGKLLQLLREARPGIKRVGILWTYVPPAFPLAEIEPGYAELHHAERLLGLKLHIVEVASVDQLPAALMEIDKELPDALLLTSGMAISGRSTIIQYAMTKRLPTISDFTWLSTPEAQPLMSYGPVFRELMRSAVFSVDKIMKGDRPGDLPIQRPSRFEMIVNLKVAKAIELTVPQELLVRADKVIE